MTEISEKRHEWFKRMRGTRKMSRTLHAAIEENDVDAVRKLLASDNPELDVNFELNGVTALELTLSSRHFEIGRLLVEKGADIDKCDKEENSLLLLASKNGHVSAVEFLIGHDADLEIANEQYETALSSATHEGHSHVVTMLIKAGANVNKSCCTDLCPLVIAVMQGHPSTLQALIEGEADVNWTDRNKKTALHYAIEHGQSDLACQLIDAGCDIQRCERHGCSALWFAANCANLQLVKKLQQAGAELNTPDHRGATAFMEAVKANNLQIVRALISAGCNVNLAETEYLYAPLHMAIINMTQIRPFRDNVDDTYDTSNALKESHWLLVRTLVEAGCDLNVTDRAGFTPLHHAAFGADFEIVELLLKHNAPVDSVTKNGDSVIQLAAYGDHPNIIDALITAGSDVNVGNRLHEAPLFTAIDHNAGIQVIKSLLRAGGRVDAVDNKGQSPLFAAIKKGYAEAVTLLIEAGADVNQPNKSGDTALWVACDMGNGDIVDALLGHPDIDVDKGVGHIPLHSAVLHGHVTIVEKLLDAGCSVNKLTDICSGALYFAADFNNHQLAKLLILHGANPQAHHGVKLPQKCCRAYRDEHPHLEQEPLQAAIRNDDFHMVKVILTASPIMPYHVLGLMRDIMFRTNYARNAGMSQIKIKQFQHFFAMILSRPRSLKESVRGEIRVCLGERPLLKVDELPLPTKLKEYLLFKDSILKDMYED